MILGREARHLWTPYGASSPQARLNEKLDDTGNRVSPVVRLKRAGLASLGDAEDNRDLRVGADGEIPRTSRRRGKTITYEGTIRADSLRELREYQSDLRQAFADRSNEGRMDVEPHPLSTVFDVDTDSRYFNARVISLDMDDITDSQRFESTFVLGLRMSDPRYFKEISLTAFKQAILDLEPELYWALDADDEASDLSGNGRDGTAQGGVTIGAAAALTGIEGDAATDFDGSNDYITSAYDPFVNGTTRTFLGLANRDTHAGVDTLIGSTAAGGPGAILDTGDSPSPGDRLVLYDSGASGSITGLPDWPGDDQAVLWVLEFIQSGAGGTFKAKLSLDGAAKVEGNIVSGAGANYGAGNLALGARNGSDPFDGAMSHFAVFERALTEEEIAAIYALTPGVLSYY